MALGQLGAICEQLGKIVTNNKGRHCDSMMTTSAAATGSNYGWTDENSLLEATKARTGLLRKIVLEIAELLLPLLKAEQQTTPIGVGHKNRSQSESTRDIEIKSLRCKVTPIG